MKRMSEVFELPLVSMPEADDQLQDANGDWALFVRFPWRADYAAHAINHVDALADALSALAWAAESGAHVELVKALCNADSALAAYRGGK